MKKLFSFTLIFTIALLIIGCNLNFNNPTNYDGVVTLMIVTPTGILEREVPFMEADEKTIFMMLEETFEIEYTLFDFGAMITKIASLKTSYGNYIAIKHNGEDSFVGASDLVYSDGDIITFELAWWDSDAQAVYEGIQSFINNYYQHYTETTLNYYVLTALNDFGFLNMDSVDIEDLNNPTTIFDYIHHILIKKALNQDVTLLQDALFDIAQIGWPYGNGLMLMALNGNVAIDLTALTQLFITDLNTRDLASLDSDTLSIVLLALDGLEHESKEEMIDDVLDVITENLYTSSYGNNAASFAHVIIALLSQGIDPRDETFNQDNNRLFDLFLTYLNSDGSFNYLVDDPSPDLYFSTPQSFLALVMMHRYLNTNQAVHPFK